MAKEKTTLEDWKNKKVKRGTDATQQQHISDNLNTVIYNKVVQGEVVNEKTISGLATKFLTKAPSHIKNIQCLDNAILSSNETEFFELIVLFECLPNSLQVRAKRLLYKNVHGYPLTQHDRKLKTELKAWYKNHIKTLQEETN